MMDKIIFVPSAVLGLAMVAAYLILCWRRHHTFNVAILVNVVLQSSGVVAGVVLVLSTVFDNLKSRLAGLDLYILISGLAVLAVSAQGLWRDVISVNREKVDEVRSNIPIQPTGDTGSAKTEPPTARG